jgi:hypothetical protein
MKSWIELVQEATEGAETPKSFIYWAAIASIAALSGNNVYLNRRNEDGRIVYKLSTNLYVIFIAESGLGKGFPIWLSKEIVKKVDCTRVISGRNSIQSIIQEMARTKTRENGGSPLMDSRAYLSSGELHNLIINDPAALTILTEWYDTHFMGDWPNTLKGSGVEELKQVNVTLLGGSSPEHFDETIPEVNIKGGFIGRTLMVVENKRSKTNPLTMIDEPKEEELFSCVTPEIVSRAKEISQLKGRFKWTLEAKTRFDPWYIEWRSRSFSDKTGISNRIPDHVLKVAMCLSLSRRNTLTLEREDIEESIIECLSLTTNTRRMTEGKGAQPLAPGTRIVLNLLIKAEGNESTRAEILNRGYGEFDSDDLDRIEKTLKERGIIDIINNRGKISYILSKEAAEQYRKFIKDGR